MRRFEHEHFLGMTAETGVFVRLERVNGPTVAGFAVKFLHKHVPRMTR